MDAKIGDWVVTPRHGKPVEIQALWYNALCTMRDFASDFNDSAGRERYASMAAETKGNFNAVFWNEDTGGLYDVVNGSDRDASIRPNQIFAVSLTHSMLEPSKARRVVELVERELLTPYGLRSLAPDDPQYRPRYEGDPLSRDSAYHQGTVWPWLLGPFLSAYVRVHQSSKQAREQAAKWLSGCEQHLTEAGLGQISEIFDADSPHHPRGCMAQAWSVAELLRVAAEDIFIDEREAGSSREAASKRKSARLLSTGSMTTSKAPTTTPAA
jgi:glycogen debranching enzyme